MGLDIYFRGVLATSVPMLGYTVPYAEARTLLTLWGLVIVLMVA